jgi:hypothetical protein
VAVAMGSSVLLLPHGGPLVLLRYLLVVTGIAVLCLYFVVLLICVAW